jgi:hypothetical protein
MGMFAEIAIVDCRLSFANQGKQTSVFCFRLQQTNGYMYISNGKLKPRQFSLIRLPFDHHANRSLSFVCLLTKKQMEVIRLQTE